MSADTFWSGVKVDWSIGKRGQKLTAVKDRLSDYHKAVTDKDKKPLQDLAEAIATYAKAKAWKGPGNPVGERDRNGNVKNTITNLIKQVDAHLARSSDKKTIWERVRLRRAVAVPTSTAAIEKARKDLDAAKGYASRDAPTFYQCIRGYQAGPDRDKPNPAVPTSLHKAPYEKIFKGGAQSGGGDPGGAVGGGDFRAALEARGIEDQKGNDPFAWDAVKVEETYKKVKDAGAGECTSFGSYAAHLLTNTDASTNPRVELVAWEKVTKKPSKSSDKIVKKVTTHVYCLVNRRGDYRQETDDNGAKRYRLPPVNEWSGDWWIVDPWAGAMGFDVIYEKSTNYPYKGMMDPLFLQMVYDD
jgi:hypothetical protein